MGQSAAKVISFVVVSTVFAYVALGNFEYIRVLVNHLFG
jgi:hypothetical protein